jgi:hypothetical protein
MIPTVHSPRVYNALEAYAKIQKKRMLRLQKKIEEIEQTSLNEIEKRYQSDKIGHAQRQKLRLIILTK